jgi:uncharacterized membrane protein YcaP (DUF421 family)
MYTLLNNLLGLDLPVEMLAIGHLVARAFLIYIAGIFLVRLQEQFMGINTPFSYMLNIMMGSLLADAIVGKGSYVAIVGVAFIIALLNWFIAFLCFYFPRMESLFKGEADLLVKDGRIQRKAMRKNLITNDELMEAVHKYTQSNDLSKVKLAYFESSGEITIIIDK